MEFFLLVNEKARITSSIPSLKKYIKESSLIKPFPHICEFGLQKISNIVPQSLTLHYNLGIEICCILKGKYEWEVDGEKYFLFPGDSFVTCPWQKHGSPEGFIDIGILAWIVIKPDFIDKNGSLKLGKWSSLSESEEKELASILISNNSPLFYDINKGELISEIYSELKNQEFGYKTRVNNLIDELLLLTARNIKKRNNNKDSFLSDLNIINAAVSEDISRNWTLEEMADLLNIGITTLNERIKKSTGYTPTNYIINLRINEAKRQLALLDNSLTEIALDCGFYSSQHFSTTFKKWTGMSPKIYRNTCKC